MSVVLTPDELRRVMGRVSRSHAEKDFQASIVTMARLLGYMAYHTYNSQRSVPGFPDLVLVGHQRTLFSELKTTLKPTPEQAEWLDALSRAGQETYCWYPRHFDRIHELLHPGWSMPEDANPADYGVWQCRTNV